MLEIIIPASHVSDDQSNGFYSFSRNIILKNHDFQAWKTSLLSNAFIVKSLFVTLIKSHIIIIITLKVIFMSRIVGCHDL